MLTKGGDGGAMVKTSARTAATKRMARAATAVADGRRCSDPRGQDADGADTCSEQPNSQQTMLRLTRRRWHVAREADGALMALARARMGGGGVANPGGDGAMAAPKQTLPCFCRYSTLRNSEFHPFYH